MLANTVAVRAPYADTPIELSMLSTSSNRYKTYYCIECRHPFLQRDGDTIYRVNNNNEPSTAHFGGGMVLTRCDRCKQKYVGTISIATTRIARTDQLHMVVQTIYIVPAAIKIERYIRCLECGGSFITLADQISKIVDNSLPLEFESPDRVVAPEARCKIGNCRQRWALRV